MDWFDNLFFFGNWKEIQYHFNKYVIIRFLKKNLTYRSIILKTRLIITDSDKLM